MLRRMAVMALAALLSVQAFAGELVKVPTNWRVDIASDGSIEAFYTGSACANGSLTVESTASEEFKNRFVSIILAAKTSKSKIQAFYYRHETTDVCNLTKVVIPRDDEPLN